MNNTLNIRLDIYRDTRAAAVAEDGQGGRVWVSGHHPAAVL
ncbi:MAG: hypothetical protein AB8B71_12070 [Paracoccaceae bacterium]